MFLHIKKIKPGFISWWSKMSLWQKGILRLQQVSSILFFTSRPNNGKHGVNGSAAGVLFCTQTLLLWSVSILKPLRKKKSQWRLHVNLFQVCFGGKIPRAAVLQSINNKDHLMCCDVILWLISSLESGHVCNPSKDNTVGTTASRAKKKKNRKQSALKFKCHKWAQRGLHKTEKDLWISSLCEDCLPVQEMPFLCPVVVGKGISNSFGLVLDKDEMGYGL